jgi:hypothetical protein
MDKSVELYCTKDDDTGEWLVWFPHPLGGMDVIGTFDNESDARQFWQDQIDTADFNDEE